MIRACTASVISMNATSRRNSINGTDRASAAATSAGGSAAAYRAAKLNDQARDAHLGQRRDVRGQLGRRLRQRDPGGEHELATAQQPPDIGQLKRVHPADRRVEPRGTRHHQRRAALDDVEVKHLAHGQGHRIVTLQHVRRFRGFIADCHRPQGESFSGAGQTNTAELINISRNTIFTFCLAWSILRSRKARTPYSVGDPWAHRRFQM